MINEENSNVILPQIDYDFWLKQGNRNESGENDNGEAGKSFKAAVKIMKDWGTGSAAPSEKRGPERVSNTDPIYKFLYGSGNLTMKKTENEIFRLLDKLAKIEGWDVKPVTELSLRSIYESLNFEEEKEKKPKKDNSKFKGRVGDDQKGFEGSNYYRDILLLIQMWGGQTGRGFMVTDTNMYSGDTRGKADASLAYQKAGGKDIGNNIDKPANLMDSILPTYREAVNLIYQGKHQEALNKITEIPQLRISFGTKHLAIIAEYFRSRGIDIPSVTIFDTRIAKLLLGKGANINDYSTVSGLYDKISKENPSAKGMTPNQIEKALFAFSNEFYDNELTKWIFDGKSDGLPEGDIQTARDIFKKRTGKDSVDREPTESTGESSNIPDHVVKWIRPGLGSIKTGDKSKFQRFDSLMKYLNSDEFNKLEDDGSKEYESLKKIKDYWNEKEGIKPDANKPPKEKGETGLVKYDPQVDRMKTLAGIK